MSSAELARRLQGFELMTTEEQDPIPFVDQEVIAGAPDLKALLVAGRRPRADMAAATEAGILVCIMPGLNSGGVADLTIVFLILCARADRPGTGAGEGGAVGQGHRTQSDGLGLSKLYGVRAGGPHRGAYRAGCHRSGGGEAPSRLRDAHPRLRPVRLAGGGPWASG